MSTFSTGELIVGAVTLAGSALGYLANRRGQKEVGKQHAAKLALDAERQRSEERRSRVSELETVIDNLRGEVDRAYAARDRARDDADRVRSTLSECLTSCQEKIAVLASKERALTDLREWVAEQVQRAAGDQGWRGTPDDVA